jgi:hypothetical protein
MVTGVLHNEYENIEASSSLLNLATMSDETLCTEQISQLEESVRLCINVFAPDLHFNSDSIYKFDYYADSWDLWMHCRIIIVSSVIDFLQRQWLCVIVINYRGGDDYFIIESIVVNFVREPEEYIGLMSALDVEFTDSTVLWFEVKNQMYFGDGGGHLCLFSIPDTESFDSIILFDSVECLCRVE